MRRHENLRKFPAGNFRTPGGLLLRSDFAKLLLIAGEGESHAHFFGIKKRNGEGVALAEF